MPRPSAPSLSERFQEATKYTPASIQAQAPLDFAAQPPPFKEWHQARRLPLEGGPAERVDPSPGPLDAARLGRLLFHTYGVTLVREYPSMTMHFRAAPSAGGLYPTELYLGVRDLPGIPDGLYAYDPRAHALVVCWEGDFWPDLSAHGLGHPVIAEARVVLIGSGLWVRSTWRYQDRGYRRVLLDTGHVFGNAALAAPPEGLQIVPIPDFHDDGIAGLLLLDETREGPLLLAAVLEGGAEAVAAPAPRHRSAIRLEADEPPAGEWPTWVQRAGKLAADAPAVDPEALAPDGGPPALGGAVALHDEPLGSGATIHKAIRRRRSTRRFLPGASIGVDALGRMLAHAYGPPGATGHVPILPDAVHTWIVATSVEGLPAGVYRYDEAAHELTLVRAGDATEALHKSCLWQELARDCAVAVVHTIDLPAAVQLYGERAYRSAHLEAGRLGQGLNLAALLLGQGASGIAGFFDEFLNELLLLDRRHAILYVTTIGVPY